MRPTLSLFTAFTLAAAASMAAASPVKNMDVAERAPAADLSAVDDVLAALPAARAAAADSEYESRRQHLSRSPSPKKHRHHKKGTKAKATWYGGGQLDAPACGGSRPSDDDLVGAVAENSPFKCHDRITLKKGNKSVTVTIVDKCEGCETYHIDLTKGAFQHLDSLTAGVVEGLEWSM